MDLRRARRRYSFSRGRSRALGGSSRRSGCGLGAPESQYGRGHPRQHGRRRSYRSPQPQAWVTRARPHHERRFPPVGVLRFRLSNTIRGGRGRLSPRALRSFRRVAPVSGGQRQPSPDSLHVRDHWTPKGGRHHSRQHRREPRCAGAGVGVDRARHYRPLASVDSRARVGPRPLREPPGWGVAPLPTALFARRDRRCFDGFTARADDPVRGANDVSSARRGRRVRRCACRSVEASEASHFRFGGPPFARARAYREVDRSRCSRTLRADRDLDQLWCPRIARPDAWIRGPPASRRRAGLGRRYASPDRRSRRRNDRRGRSAKSLGVCGATSIVPMQLRRYWTRRVGSTRAILRHGRKTDRFGFSGGGAPI